ncbi:MAG: alpha/beta hydrolase [Actinobacteria bacterium]|nr:alpha/beta hydrolase [Actinomycetota bacterium]
MRLLPSPRSLTRAAENVADRVLHGRLADVTPLPSTVIDDGPQCKVLRYEGAARGAEPVLLVPPLASPAFVFDMRRGCSMAEYLLDAGRAPYLVDYGTMTFDERHLGLEHWVRYVLPRAIAAVSADTGGRKVHLVGWCLGGTLAALAAADDPALALASVTLVASPLDARRVPMFALLRPLIELTNGAVGTAIYRAIGVAPGPVVKRAFQLATFDKYLTKPLAVLQNLGDRDYLEQVEAVDRLMDNMLAYPGRSMGQLYHDVFRANTLADGTITLEDRRIDLHRLSVPVLSVAGKDDGIAPPAAVHHIGTLVKNARLELAPGGHLGVIAGREAVNTTWPIVDRFVTANARP